jgi:hypothetical protein
MGCAESKSDGSGGSSQYPSSLQNFHTLNIAFMDRTTAKIDCPMEALDYQFIKSLNEQNYGTWAEKQIALDDKLRLTETQSVLKFAESLLN